jgi:hypothetical protein
MMRSTAVPRPADPRMGSLQTATGSAQLRARACRGFQDKWPCAWEAPEAVDLAPSQAAWRACSAERWLGTVGSTGSGLN